MPTTSDKVCRLPDGKEVPISGLQDPSSCRNQGGTIVDAGGSSQQRISGDALRAQLSTARWREPVGDSGLQVRDFGAVLLSFPLCEIQRRLPRARLVQLLDRIDTEFAAEVDRMMDEDADLRKAVYRLVLNGASAAAVALANDDGEPAENFAVSDELVDHAISVGREIAARSGSSELTGAVRDASDLVQSLRGMPIEDVLEALTDQRRSSETATI